MNERQVPDPADGIPEVWQLMQNRQLTEGKARQIAASPSLARAATAAGSARLGKCLVREAHQHPIDAHTLLDLMMLHGEALLSATRSREALALLDPIIEFLATAGWSPAWLARCRRNRAAALGMEKHFEQEAHEFQEVAQIYRDLEMFTEAAECRLSRGLALSMLGRHEEALAEVNGAKADFLLNGDAVYVGLSDKYRGDLFSKLGRFAEAVTALSTAEEILTAGGATRALAECRLGLSNVLLRLGHFERAIAVATAAEVTFTRDNRMDKVAECQHYRAGALNYLGRYTDALTEFGKAENGFLANNMVPELEKCRANRAGTLLALGRFEEALEEYRTAEASSSLILRAHAALNRGNVLQELYRFDESLAAYDEAASRFEAYGNAAVDLASCRMNKGGVLRILGRHEEARIECAKAEPVFVEQGMDARLAFCQMIMAESFHKAARNGDALTLLRAIDVKALNYDWLWRYYNCLATILWANGDHEQSLECFSIGRQAIKRARHAAGIDESALEFVEARRDLVRESIRCALHMNAVELAWCSVQDGKGNVLADRLLELESRGHRTGQGELLRLRKRLGSWLHAEPLQSTRGTSSVRVAEEIAKREEPGEGGDFDPYERETLVRARAYFRECRRSAKVDVHEYLAANDQLSRTQAAIPDDWALLDFWVLDRMNVKVFIVTKNTVCVENVAARWNDLDVRDAIEEANRWRVTAEAGRDDILDLFFDQLFKPILERLSGIKGLYLVPHAYLHLLPLHACRDESGDYLSDRFEIAYLPSASLLADLPAPIQGGEMISLANPDRNTAKTLPFSEWEARELYSSLRLAQHSVSIGDEATMSRLQEWGQASVVHLSCHGVGHDRLAGLSRLRLADDVLLAHDVLFRLPTLKKGAVVVLNGCQTGFRDLRSVDEGMGLMSAFLATGASFALASQWSLGDCCAAEMVVQFLKEMILNGASATAALRVAQNRARSISYLEIVERCERLLKSRFPHVDFPNEASTICMEAMSACVDAGDMKGGKHFAGLASKALRTLGRKEEGERVESFPEAMERQDDMAGKSDRIYEHAVHWAPLHIVGRPTM